VYDEESKTAALHIAVFYNRGRMHYTPPNPVTHENIGVSLIPAEWSEGEWVGGLTEGYTLARVYYCPRFMRHLDCGGAVLIWEITE
jgi:hypothetical protein